MTYLWISLGCFVLFHALLWWMGFWQQCQDSLNPGHEILRMIEVTLVASLVWPLSLVACAVCGGHYLLVGRLR